MTASTTLKWALLALAGLIVAIAVAIAASELTSQRIGLASEPLGAGEALAPPAARGERGRPSGDPGARPGGQPTTAPPPATTTTAPPTATTTAPPVETTGSDYTGGGDDGGGGGEDD